MLDASVKVKPGTSARPRSDRKAQAQNTWLFVYDVKAHRVMVVKAANQLVCMDTRPAVMSKIFITVSLSLIHST